MGFDIRTFQENISAPEVKNTSDEYWTQGFIKEIDDRFNMINEECENLYNRMTPRSEQAFLKKIQAWKGLVTNLQALCKLYKISYAKCLSPKN